MTEAILKVSNLNVRFGGLVALDNVCLEVRPGQIHAVIGPNGAGKSTLFNAISGLVPLSSGQVYMGGVDISVLPSCQRPRFGMMRTFQSLQLIKAMTVLENLLLGLHGRRSRLFGNKTLMRRLGRRKLADKDQAIYVADRLGLTPHLYKTVDLLSFKDQRFVEIGRALVSDPQLVMLDEPAAGLAAPEIDELRDILVALQAEKGFAILLVEHVMSFVMQMCHHVTVLEYGAVIASGTGPDVMADSRVIKAYLGEELDA